jgi:hypothetical protein
MTAIQQMMLGAAPDPIIEISPITHLNLGGTSSNTFASTTVTVTNAVPSSYTWSFLSPFGGTFAIIFGQGTSTVDFEVSGVVSGNTASTTLRCTMVINGRNYTIDCPVQYERF